MEDQMLRFLGLGNADVPDVPDVPGRAPDAAAAAAPAVPTADRGSPAALTEADTRR
jgi:hypothetical protein